MIMGIAIDEAAISVTRKTLICMVTESGEASLRRRVEIVRKPWLI
jgi:hypothetical protein